MSKRRNIDDVVYKIGGAGFGEPPCTIRLLDIDERDGATGPCLLDCGDPDCQEWYNTERLDSNGNFMYDIYHVSECEMEDL